MRVDIIEGRRALDELRANWDAVYDADPEAQFFLSWPWLSKWLGTIRKPWFILAVRPDDAAPYVAFFPLWLQTLERESGGFYNEIHMGGHHTADYVGFLCRPEFQEQAIPALANRVKQLNWTNLRLESIRASDHRLALFMREFSGDAFDLCALERFNEDKVDCSICPMARLPADWDAYLDGSLSANTRQKIRRLLRQLEKSSDLKVTHADKDTIDRDLETLLRLWNDRWGVRKGKMLGGILRNYRLMLRHCFEIGTLFLPVLWHGDRTVGALAILIDARKKAFHFFIAGRDEAFDGPPTGTILHAHSIRHAIQNGFATYDFLRGNEPYKYSFGVEEHRITCFMLATKDRTNLGGRLDRRSLPMVLRRSNEHLQAGRPVAAEYGFRQALEVEPSNPEAAYGMGCIMAARGEHAAATALLRAAVAAMPDASRAWFWLARSLRASGEPAEAVAAYCAGIEGEPAIAGAYHELGQVLLDLGCFDQALAAFDAVAELQPDFPDIYASLMQALRSQGEASPEDPSQRPSLNAGLSDRIGRLRAIAAARRNREGSNMTPMANRRIDIVPPFVSQAISAHSVSRQKR